VEQKALHAKSPGSYPKKKHGNKMGNEELGMGNEKYCDQTARLAMQLQVAPPGGILKVLWCNVSQLSKSTNHERI